MFNIALIALSVLSSAHARPMIEVGAGAMASSSGEMSVVLKLSTPGFRVDESGEMSGIILARFKGEVAVGAVPGQAGELPYFDIEFIPLGMGTFVREGLSPGLSGGMFGVLPVHASRDVRVDRDLTVRVTALAFAVQGMVNDRDDRRSGAFVKLAVDALGYKAAKYAADNRDTFHGFSIGGAEAEAGLALSPLSRSFKVLVVAGARGDIAYGNQGFLSDGSVYAEVRAEIREFMQLFLRGSLIAAEGADDAAYDTEARLMAGVGFVF